VMMEGSVEIIEIFVAQLPLLWERIRSLAALAARRSW
jgi:hypothetical protein